MVPTGPRSAQELNQNKARRLSRASPAAGVSSVSSANTKALLMIPAVAIDLWARRARWMIPTRATWDGSMH